MAHAKTSHGSIAVAIIVLSLLIIGGVAYWYDSNHPCLRYETYTTRCGGAIWCAAYDSNFNCVMYSSEDEYSCDVTQCAERK